MRTFEYRLYPHKEQSHLLMQCLSESRHVYNEMLETVKTQYEEKGTFPGKYDLTARFKGRGGEHVPATTVQCLADRLSKSLKRFLARKEPAKMGKSIKIKLHRPVEGKPKAVHLVLRADGHWYALIVCETIPQTEHLPSTCEHPDIGLDVGLKSFLTDSEGNTVDNPRFYRSSQRTLRRKQRQLSRRKKGSHRRRKAAKNVAKTHLKIDRQRRDHHFKTAKPYAEGYQRIAVEDLQITNMVKNHHLAKSIMDASWSAFLTILSDKAARAGHCVRRVNPRFTSQNCHNCGEIVQKSLSVRTHICPFCGSVADRDVNAAKNILSKAGAQPSGVKHPDGDVSLRSPRL